MTSHAALHGPVVVNACNACHEVESDELHTYRLARKARPCAPSATTSPSTRPSSTPRSLLAPAPVAMIRTAARNVAPQQADRGRTLRDVPRRCARSSGTKVHGPVAAGPCSGAIRRTRRSIRNCPTPPSRDLCLDCHVSMCDADRSGPRRARLPPRWTAVRAMIRTRATTG